MPDETPPESPKGPPNSPSAPYKLTRRYESTVDLDEVNLKSEKWLKTAEDVPPGGSKKEEEMVWRDK